MRLLRRLRRWSLIYQDRYGCMYGPVPIALTASGADLAADRMRALGGTYTYWVVPQ